VGKVGVGLATGNSPMVAEGLIDAGLDTGAMLTPYVPAGLQKVGRTAIREGAEALTKRGPKTDPSAPHNATIRAEADRLESEGSTILAGGGRERERLIPTPGGEKSGRRPDILYRDADGQVRGTNVGRTNADGSPVKREVGAMNDLNQVGVPTEFKPYDR